MLEGKGSMTCWKSVVGYEGLYEVSDAGEVRNAAGDVMKTGLDKDGYRKVNLCKDLTQSTHRVHRLVAIAFIQNPDGKQCVDHINGVRSDNYVANLRWATLAENSHNVGISKANKIGFKGVSFHKRDQKYVARIRVNNKRIHLGYFNTAEEAYAAYCAKAAELFGVFARLV